MVLLGLLTAACADRRTELRVGDWVVDAIDLDREGVRRHLGTCATAKELAEEELIRRDHCSRENRDPACLRFDRVQILRNAVADATRSATAPEASAVAKESQFLAERESQEPGLSRKLAGARATRAKLRSRAERARRHVLVTFPSGCTRSAGNGSS